MFKDFFNRLIILCIAIVIVIALILFTIFRFVYSTSILEFEEKQNEQLLSLERVSNQILAAIESTNMRLDTLIDQIAKNIQASKDSMNQLIAMNTAFLSWAETQGLIVRE